MMEGGKKRRRNPLQTDANFSTLVSGPRKGAGQCSRLNYGRNTNKGRSQHLSDGHQESPAPSAHNSPAKRRKRTDKKAEQSTGVKTI